MNHSEDSGVADGGCLLGLSVSAADLVELIDDFLSIDDFSEYDVLAVEPGAGYEGDEELGSVGVGSGVGHGQPALAVVLQGEVLVGELVAVDGLAAGA